ncbi:MAG: histidine triad nucleotide-binding protein [Candidatus Saccharicenans sp.]|jgi:histidine triad (HIT) family protein|nr:histidine triad nucleotide-binding protein [Candidatus Saccharicenans sp.]MDH7492919.1 histidine triad nucleotide-binding protein [Candidatus Saccharicenans sp.]
MSDCIFCKIIRKEIPAAIVYEDDEILAFDDIRPQAPVHTLIIPKAHLPGLKEAEKEQAGLLGRILLQAGEIARLKGIDRSGFRVVVNSGPDSGQEVFHLHFHLLGGRRLGWPPG